MTNKKIQSTKNKTPVLLKIFTLLISIIAIMLLQFSGETLSFVEDSLVGHMFVEHSIFFLMGYSAAALLNKQNMLGLYRQINYYIFVQKNLPYIKKDIQEKEHIQSKIKYLWLLTGIFLMIFWHIPFVFDVASYDELVHVFQHISFIFVGVSIYKIISEFDFSFLLFFFILSGGFMGIMGLVLALTKLPIYSYYTVQSHIDGGGYMIISGIIMMFVILPVVLIKKAIESL